MTRLQASTATIALARQSQAVVVEAVDRLARARTSNEPRLAGRLWTLQLRAGALLGEEPRQVLDDAYGLAEKLIGLHRQFAQRLLEAMDTRPDPVDAAAASPSASSNVVPLVRGARRSRH
jgi:hypothetical protein